MTKHNDEGMKSLKIQEALSHRSFVIWSLFRHSSFVIHHFRPSRRTRAAATVISVTTVFLLFGHTALAVDVLEEVVEQKYDVDANATLAVSNIDGSIRVYGTEAPQIHIQAIKKAYSRERLEGIVVDVKATPGSVAITTSFPPRQNAVSDRSGTVDYIIVVPQAARITELKLTNGELLVEGLRNGGSATAHLVNGWMAGHNCFADLNLSVDRGRLDVAFDWWENHTFSIKASSVRGNLRAFLPSDASVSLNAVAVEGRVANAFEAKKKPDSGEVVHSIATVIGNEAGAAISMEAARGNVRIDKTY